MPLLTEQDLATNDQQTVTYTLLDGSDTFVVPSGKSYLLTRNPTVSTVNATMIGDEAPVTHNCPGFGTQTTSPVNIDVLADEDVSHYLSALTGVLDGTVTITGGTGLEVALITV